MSKEENTVNTSDDEDFIVQFFTNTETRSHKRHVLKSKENIFKSKSTCRRVLKNKLKKYKLRKDGQEDPDVIDISKSLSASLKIHYNLQNNNFDEIIDEWRINYLTKMAKKNTKSLQKNKHEGYNGKNEYENSKSNKITTSPESNEPISALSDDVEVDEIENGSQKVVKMNAFMLMMGARDKSIGSNSTGKERTEENSQDDTARKSLKLKRSIALEKMSVAKGYHKNKELEEMRDHKIKSKLEKRALCLKNMIDKTAKIAASRNHSDDDYRKDGNQESVSKRPRKNEPGPEKLTKRLKVEMVDKEDEDDVVVVEIEGESLPISNVIKSDVSKSLSSERIFKAIPEDMKRKSKADVEFLSKLSPSIKKKESVLSYFNKVERTNGETENENCDVSSENVIKVKFTPKSKKKLLKRNKELQNKEEVQVKAEKNGSVKRRKLHKGGKIISENMNTDVLYIAVDDREPIIETDKAKEKNQDDTVHKKIKSNVRGRINHLNTTDELEIDDQGQEHRESIAERRSTRIKKKPVKYQCIVDTSDDDDDFGKEHKKPKMSSVLRLKKDSVSKLKVKYAAVEDVYASDKEKIKNTTPQPKKVAPVFVNKAELEAKRKFLQSGIPDQLKKIIDRQKNTEIGSFSFNAVCHVQQKYSNNYNFGPWDLKAAELDFVTDHEEVQMHELTHEFILNLRLDKLPEANDMPKPSFDCVGKLQEMKRNYPKFPVYRIFKLLKKKCKPRGMTDADADKSDGSVDIESLLESPDDDPKTALWCDTFRPTSTDDIIGNFEAVTLLKNWLTNWKDSIIEGRSQRMHMRSESSDSSDFYCPSDSDSRDSHRTFSNVLVVTGPPGCGKTSAIYAVAKELALKVIEVNASSKRSGKIILSSLQEATQSHKVNRVVKSGEHSQYSQDMVSLQIKKRSKSLNTYSRKLNSQRSRENNEDSVSNSENARQGMSFILVEDADIVFEQDDGFISALNQIIQTSKRPVILVTSSLTVPHVQKYVNNANVISFHHLMPKMLGMWLDVMCLVENNDVWPSMGQRLLEFHKGDIRKSINSLQFWFARDKLAEETDSEDPIIEEQEKLVDADSPGSWTDQDQQQSKQIQNQSKDLNVHLFKTFISGHDHDIGITKSILQFPVNNLNFWWNIPQIFHLENSLKSTDYPESENRRCLKSMARLIDSVAFSDVLSSKLKPSFDASILSRPWRTKLGDCVSETVNMASYSRLPSTGESMEYALLTSSVDSAQKAFRLDQICIDYTLPGYTQIRSRDKILNRHKGLTDAIPLSCQLDRTGVALDYFSAYREICRQEKEKSDNNSKRNNRFCHYLRSVKVTSSSETLELLCDSLNSFKDC